MKSSPLFVTHNTLSSYNVIYEDEKHNQYSLGKKENNTKYLGLLGLP